jgi:small conductance mechanosensitive channel
MTTIWKGMLDKLQTWVIGELPGLLIALFIGFIALKVISFSFKKLKKTLIKRAGKSQKTSPVEAEKRINTLIAIAQSVTVIIIWSILVMIFLKKFGVDIGPVLAGAGIIGLAVGFGAQELVRDFISGFFLLLENQIRTGDVAIINGTGGLVEKIELRTITLRDFSGVVHIFQNGKINSLSNMTKEWSAMVFDMGVAYKEDPDTVIKVMKEVGDELYNDPDFKEKIIEPIEVFGVDQFANSAVIIKARLKTQPIQQWTVGREYRKRLKYAFDKLNIEIPFPHTTVYWGDKIKPLQLDVNDEMLDKIENKS